MSERHSDSDGSDIFWPGYVDAVTNLVLNLLFLITILTVAVFMFALELGRASSGGPAKTAVSSTKQDAKVALTDPVKENIALKLEIQRLNKELTKIAQPVHPGAIVKTIDATSSVPKPLIGVDKTLVNDFELIVRFKDDSVAFTPAEHDSLLESLQPLVANGKANISVEVQAGFSEAKRMGFYRAMAVRNLLIEMKLPKELIDVSVREVKSNANASIVRVKAR